MTQLEYYTNVLTHFVAIVGLVGGLFSLGLFAVGAFYLYPWIRK